jgi:hypothetical protein
MTDIELARDLATACYFDDDGTGKTSIKSLTALILAALQAAYSKGYNELKGDLAKLLQAERERAIEECKATVAVYCMASTALRVNNALDALKEAKNADAE